MARDLVRILELQRPAAVGTALATAVLGTAIAVLAPGILPPHPLVGAAVGLAAIVLAVAAAVAADAGDHMVRGARHVRPTGARIVASGRDPLPALVAWAAAHLEEQGGLRLAVVAAGADSKRAGPIADAIGMELAQRGARVVVADLSVPDAQRAGAAEVGRGEARVSDSVIYDPRVSLARLGSGQTLVDGLTALPRIATALSRDIDVFIAALPGLRHPGSLLGATAADRSLLLAVQDESSKVDVIAGLDALDAARAPADVVVVPPDVRLQMEGSQAAARSSTGSGADGRAAVGQAGGPEPTPGEPRPTPGEPRPDPAPQPDPDPHPSPGEPQPDPAPQPDPDPRPSPDPEPAPRPEPVPQPDPEPVPRPDPGPAYPEPGPEVPQPLREPPEPDVPSTPDVPPEVPPRRDPDPPAPPAARAPHRVDTGPIGPPAVQDRHEVISELQRTAAVIALEHAVARRQSEDLHRRDDRERPGGVA